MVSSEYYSPLVIEHFQHPRNVGAMADADAEAYVTNPVCGDSLRLFLKIEDGHITRAQFLSSGCPASIATSSAATELLAGKPLDEAVALPREAYADAVGGLPKSKIHCSVLAASAVRQAVDTWREKTTTEAASS